MQRKGVPAKPAPAKRPSQTNKGAVSNTDKVTDDLLKLYGDPDKGGKTITAEGVQKLCTGFGINPETDSEILVFMWLCDCKNYAEITREELKAGVAKVHVDSADKLKNRKDYLTQYLKDKNSADFRNFFKFLFIYHREPGQKCVDVETGLLLMTMVLGKAFKLFEPFKKFVEEREVKFFSLDQWENTLEVFKMCNQSIDNYDVAGACKLRDI